MPQTKTCRGYAAGNIPPHEAEDTTGPDGFPPGKNQCRRCYAAYYADWKAKGPQQRSPRKGAKRVDFSALAGATASDEFVSDEDLATSRSHAYRADPDLVRLWHAVVSSAAEGNAPGNIIF